MGLIDEEFRPSTRHVLRLRDLGLRLGRATWKREGSRKVLAGSGLLPLQKQLSFLGAGLLLKQEHATNFFLRRSRTLELVELRLKKQRWRQPSLPCGMLEEASARLEKPLYPKTLHPPSPKPPTVVPSKKGP